MSQTGAFEMLGSRLGLGPKSRAAYVAIDLGLREPTDAEQRVLVEWLGSYPADMETLGDTPVPGLSDLVVSLNELVGELRRARLERDELREELGGFREALAELGVRRLGGPKADPASEPRAIVQAGG